MANLLNAIRRRTSRISRCSKLGWMRTMRKVVVILSFTLCMVSSAVETVGLTPCEEITGRNDCVTPSPFQPSLSDMRLVSRLVDTDDDAIEFERHERFRALVIVDGVPYYRYWLLDEESHHVFHPMRYGRYVLHSAEYGELHAQLLDTAQRTGIELPNGGLAFYYPNHYPLNRMRGPDLVYSAISQSEILAGFLRLYQRSGSDLSKSILDGVKRALFFDHLNGGVDLGVALLELPLFRSNPEVILDGWLHALLHLNDYAVLMNDPKVASYVEESLDFFADNHSVWYDEQRSISRYSDTSPQRVVFVPTVEDQKISVIYKARDSRLMHYSIEPVMDLKNEFSAFDVRVVSVNRGNAKRTVVVTCAGLFDTYVVSSEPFELSLRSNAYDPFRATPGAEGDWQTVQADLREEQYVVHVNVPEGELICGYPTNFARSHGKNYYHVYHIVALQYLAKHSSYDNEELNVRLSSIAYSWWHRTKDFTRAELLFEEPQVVLNRINGGKVLTQATDVNSLLDW